MLQAGTIRLTYLLSFAVLFLMIIIGKTAFGVLQCSELLASTEMPACLGEALRIRSQTLL